MNDDNKSGDDDVIIVRVVRPTNPPPLPSRWVNSPSQLAPAPTLSAAQQRRRQRRQQQQQQPTTLVARMSRMTFTSDEDSKENN